MNLKVYDDVKLNTELEELAEKGIYKGETGIVFDINADSILVCFLNSKNYGDYACCDVNKKYLDICSYPYAKHIDYLEKLKKKGNFKTEFRVNPFNEFDWVEVLVEKEEYAKEGLHKGMYANVLFDYAIDDKLPVMFPDEEGYDVEVSVNIADIKLHRRIEHK